MLCVLSVWHPRGQACGGPRQFWNGVLPSVLHSVPSGGGQGKVCLAVSPWDSQCALRHFLWFVQIMISLNSFREPSCVAASQRAHSAKPRLNPTLFSLGRTFRKITSSTLQTFPRLIFSWSWAHLCRLASWSSNVFHNDLVYWPWKQYCSDYTICLTFCSYSCSRMQFVRWNSECKEMKIAKINNYPTIQKRTLQEY